MLVRMQRNVDLTRFSVNKLTLYIKSLKTLKTLRLCEPLTLFSEIASKEIIRNVNTVLCTKNIYHSIVYN